MSSHGSFFMFYNIMCYWAQKRAQKVMPHQMTLSMQISFMQIYANEVYIYALLHNIMSMQMDIYIYIYVFQGHWHQSCLDSSLQRHVDIYVYICIYIYIYIFITL